MNRKHQTPSLKNNRAASNVEYADASRLKIYLHEMQGEHSQSVDSALARATQAVRRGDENSAMHIKLAKLATWLAFSRLRANLDQMIMSSIVEDKVEKELACVRAKDVEQRATGGGRRR